MTNFFQSDMPLDFYIVLLVSSNNSRLGGRLDFYRFSYAMIASCRFDQWVVPCLLVAFLWTAAGFRAA